MSDTPLDIPRQAGIYVRSAREERGLTRDQLAQRAGVSKRMLASLELGDSAGVRLDKLMAVLGALGLGLSLRQIGETKTVASRPAKTDERPARASSESSSAFVPPYDELLADFLANGGYGEKGSFQMVGRGDE